MIYRLAQILFWWFFKLFYPTKVVGRKNMPKGAAIISSNHTSNFDAILVVLNTWEKKYFLTKKELFKNKFMSFLLRGMNCIKIDRQSTDITAIKQSLKVLKDGKKLFIFPEGTRNKSDNLELGEVKQGVSMFAIKAKVPIVPMYISRKPKIFHKTIITIGEAFELNDYYGQKANEEVLDRASKIVTEKMKLLQEQAIEFSNKKKTKRKRKIIKEA